MSIKTQVSRHKKFFFNSKFETSMKHVIFIFLFFGLSAVSAQTNVEFAYDAAGNRIRRTVIVLEKKNKEIEKDTFFYSDFVRNEQTEDGEAKSEISVLSKKIEIQIFPNPTEGNITIRIFDYSSPPDFSLFTLNGQLLFNKKTTGNETEIDLSQYPAGHYILKMKLKSQVKEFKIIKQ